jgi:cytochrome c biogenesis protein CcmG, thiol:disulfide interchange protein DsbE
VKAHKAPVVRIAAVALPLTLFAALAVFLSLRLYAGDPSNVPSALIGKPVPVFSLPPLEGLRKGDAAMPGLNKDDFKRGITLVNVWASWCGPCRDEHPLLMDMAKRPDVQLVGINYKDDPSNALRFLTALGNPFSAVGADTSGRAAIDWGVYGVPETFVVNAEGVIIDKHIGPLTEDSIRTRIFPLLSAK